MDYLATFGKFPIEVQNWTESDLNFTKLITENKLEYFLNFKVQACRSPTDGVEILCAFEDNFYSWKRYVTTNLEYTSKDITDMFELLQFPTENVFGLTKELKEKSKEVKQTV